MARPRKLGLNYFPFDVDFFEDDRVLLIGATYGSLGEIIIIRLLSMIYNNGYYIQWNEINAAKIQKEMRGESVKTLLGIINRLINVGFFDRELFETHQILTSADIQSRYFEATKGRKLEAKDLPYLLVLPANYNILGAGVERTEKAETPVAQVPGQPSAPTTKTGGKGGKAAKYTARNEFWNKFFDKSNMAAINNVCSELSISYDKFVEYAMAVVNEWQLEEKLHRGYADAAANLISHVRRKACYNSNKERAPEPKIDAQAAARSRRAELRRSREETDKAEPLTWEEYCRKRGIDTSENAASYMARTANEEIEHLRSRF